MINQYVCTFFMDACKVIEIAFCYTIYSKYFFSSIENLNTYFIKSLDHTNKSPGSCLFYVANTYTEYLSVVPGRRKHYEKICTSVKKFWST